MSTGVCRKCGGAVITYGANEKCLECGRLQSERVEQGWFRLSQAARYLGVSTRTVRETLVRPGHVTPQHRKGSKELWYSREDLDRAHWPAGEEVGNG